MSLEKSARSHTILTGLMLGLLVVGLSCFAAAQSEPAPPPPPPGTFHVMTAGPMGGTGGMMHDGMGEGMAVKGAPLSADLMMTRDTTLADGNRIHTENQTKIYRDASGRVRREDRVRAEHSDHRRRQTQHDRDHRSGGGKSLYAEPADQDGPSDAAASANGRARLAGWEATKR